MDPIKAGVTFAIIMLVAVGAWRAGRPRTAFGLANQITTIRAFLVALVAGGVGEPASARTAAAAVGISLLVTLLDGVDGWAARRSNSSTAFGARFDMEIDALLILVLAILVWQHGKAGSWVVLSGLLRYLFVAGGWMLPWLRRPLTYSRRRQTVCVVQIGGLMLALTPAIGWPISATLAAIALIALCYSFIVDTLWLWHRVLKLALALAVLNAALAFQNFWPTPAIRWEGELSIEFAIGVLVVVIARRWLRSPSRAAVGVTAALWVVLTIGHYADVTAPALYGREINLYWDLRYMPDVAAMVIHAAPLWLVLLVAAVAATALGLLYRLFRWALRGVADHADDPRARRAIVSVAAIVIALFSARQLPLVGPVVAGVPMFATPVTATYSRQARFVANAMAGSRPMAASPEMNSDLSLVQGTDVYLIFIESYGAIAFERADIAPRLTAGRATLDDAIRATHRRVVSGYVDSPTFGGSSWLAHISLMSGVEVRDPETNARLMTEKRGTLVTEFARHGHTTIALMPGLRQRWPEGSFYGFDQIFDATRLDYRGPEFGWFAIPDQYSLAKFDTLVGNQASRPPFFMFYPTISTHFPFSPTPPYQPDWSRMFDARPYDGPSIVRAYAKQPDWTNFAPGYVDAVSYTYDTLSGFLRSHADRDFVMILLGDHQPAAAVSGEGASWSVPVHVIASRPRILERLTAHGFRDGLTPARPSLAPMNALLPILLDSFGDRQPVAEGTSTAGAGSARTGSAK